MRLTRLQIHHVRNLLDVAFSLHPKFNIFLGENASGKTSLLEAIHFLAVGRSFRTHQSKVVIAYQQTMMACYGEVMDEHQQKFSMGIEKNRRGELKCKVGGENCDRLSTFAATLPLQIITPETFRLLIAGSEERRRYLDWGVFHVEPIFAQACQRYQRLLKQRNAALKQAFDSESLLAWEKELATIGETITRHRQAHIVILLAYINKARQLLLPSLNVDFDYKQGWSPHLSLEEALAEALPLDKKRGYTSVGPHRAEIIITAGDFPAHTVLSRGQQKLLICALYVAQAQQLSARVNKKCLYLIDDLASELDQESRGRLLALLAAQDHQVLLTTVDPHSLDIDGQFSGQMFHVEHGRVKESGSPLASQIKMLSKSPLQRIKIST